MTGPSSELLVRVQAWIADDPDEATRGVLESLVEAARSGDAAALDDLSLRFSDRLQFGTAGLRGPMGAGPMAMNRVTVRRAAAGLARYLLDTDPAAAERGVVVGFDGRHQSDVFALDSAAVFAGHGMAVHLLERPLPTPVIAFSVVEAGACAGVMVTASHNPPGDNGYKVYLADGAQIVPPMDTAIAARIDAVGRLADVPMVDAEHTVLVRRCATEMVDAYVAHAASVRLVPADAVEPVRVAYTALHGVGADVLDAVFARAGLAPVHHVDAQRRPDGRFPTVSFPNPEEPGAMDLVLALADDVDADVVLANDPDADRLAVAIRVPAGVADARSDWTDGPGRAGARGGWRVLAGDEIGWLLADHVLRHTAGDDRLVVTTLVSSTLLATMAEAYGVHHRETPTGFKWIAATAREHPGLRLVFGYEQALGYLVSTRPLDKDGVTAAVLLAEAAGLARRDGVMLQDRLDELAARFGRHRTAERSVRLEPAAAAAAVDRLRGEAPAEIAGVPVEAITEPIPGLVRFSLTGGSRVQVRRSGTEPKVKVYAESVGDGEAVPLAEAVAALLGR